ncbi:PP2C family protein-serine/threonine phosphatase [Streptomyces sp. NPDC004393]
MTAWLPAPGRAGIAGDCFDVIALSGTRVGLVVIDVAGRGISAIARAGRLLTAIRTLAGLDLAPDELLARLDTLVGRAVDAHVDAIDPGAGVVASCLCVVYDPVTGRCCVASAGHPAPAVVRPGQAAELLNLPIGPPLGVGGLPFEAVEIDLPDGSVLALYTNGLTQDRKSGPDASLAGLLCALSQADLPLELLHQQAWEAALDARLRMTTLFSSSPAPVPSPLTASPRGTSRPTPPSSRVPVPWSAANCTCGTWPSWSP